MLDIATTLTRNRLVLAGLAGAAVLVALAVGADPAEAGARLRG